MLWRTHRDQLAIVFLIVAVALFLVDLYARVNWQVGLAGEVIGYLITVGTLVAQFYFRKSGPDS